MKKKTFDTVKGANEWFCCDLETVKKAIHAVKNGRNSLNASDISYTQTPIIFRPEQQAAIDKTKNSSRKGLKCSGMQKCVSAKLFAPCAWQEI